MFYYYGAKNQLAPRYPAPLPGSVVVEPFAGSAAYAQLHRRTHHDVVLVDSNPATVWLWRTLQAMTVAEVLALPVPEVGRQYDDPLTDALIKACAASNAVARMTGPLACPKRVAETWCGQLRRIAERLDACRSWVVHCGDYSESLGLVSTLYPGRAVTWFVDPPYHPQGRTHPLANGRGYKGGDTIDYDALGQWVDGLPGAVIVCEQAGAPWLPDFKPLRGQRTSVGKPSLEVVACRGIDQYVLFL